MEIRTLEVAGFEPAMRAMRNPKNSHSKNDTHGKNIGPDDTELSLKLQKAGPEHCKHLRQIVVWFDITAPLTFHKQLDTYRFGVEKISTSTMHKLMSRKLTADDFEPCNVDCYGERLLETIDYLNELIEAYNKEEDQDEKKRLWEYAIQILPESFLQTRTVMMSYAALRNIVNQRKGHKLRNWEQFIDWAHTLPNSWMILE